MNKKKLGVIIPVYNEERYIEKVLNNVLSCDEVAEIVVINDGSTDQTSNILNNKYKNHSSIKIIEYDNNTGKGFAIRLALTKITTPYIIIQDADLEYSVKDYSALLLPLLDNTADVVFGARFLGNNADTFIHQLGNRFLTILSNFTTGLSLNDMETCYKLFRSDILKNLDLQSNRFEIEVEITAKIAKIEGLRITEIPILYNARNIANGKKITWKDGIIAVYNIFKYSRS